MRGLVPLLFVGREDRVSRGVSLGCSFLNGVFVEGILCKVRRGVGFSFLGLGLCRGVRQRRQWLGLRGLLSMAAAVRCRYC